MVAYKPGFHYAIRSALRDRVFSQNMLRQHKGCSEHKGSKSGIVQPKKEEVLIFQVTIHRLQGNS